MSRLDASREFLPLPCERAEISLDLNPVPESVRLTEESAEADRYRWRDGAFAEHDFVDRPRRHTYSPSHDVLRNAHRLQVFFQQDFAGSDGLFQEYNV